MARVPEETLTIVKANDGSERSLSQNYDLSVQRTLGEAYIRGKVPATTKALLLSVTDICMQGRL